MAKKSALRKKQDNFIIKVIVGFSVVIIGLISALLIYNATKVQYNYDDYDFVTKYADMETQEEDKYLLYYYSEYCSFCTQIKDEILAFTDSNAVDAKVYLMDQQRMEDPNPFPRGTAGSGTPTMHVVVDGEIVDSIVGPDSILNALEAIEAGTHDTYPSN